MGRKRDWSTSDEKKLVDNYTTSTIQELMDMFPNRSQESINNKIKRLKADGKITSGKDEKTIQRAYDQRKGRDVAPTIE